MKKSFIIIIAAFAMASAAFAQTEKDSVWAAKAAEKAKKVQDAADLKAFKEKQKADLAAFIDRHTFGIAVNRCGRGENDIFEPLELINKLGLLSLKLLGITLG